MSLGAQMKKLLLGGSFAFAVVAWGSANAADLGQPVYKAPPPPAPVYSWTGCYLGVQGGGGTMSDTWADQTGAGALAGGQVGCNYQIDHIVLGVEGEGWWSGFKDNDKGFEGVDSGTDTTTNRWDFDVALRAGFAWDRALIYGKVGAAWGRFEFNETFLDPPDSGTDSGRVTLPGLLLGVGGEYAFSPNWSARLEYEFIDFIAQSTDFTGTETFFPLEQFIESQSARKQIVKIGLNYKVTP
jgi:outer membrane immunogenic protein